jgi:hypothetical protein
MTFLERIYSINTTTSRKTKLLSRMNTEPVIQIPVRVRMTPEEYAAYFEARYPNRPICCFCGVKVQCPYGNNPAPVAKKGKCCGGCNTTVVFARMGLISVDEAKSALRDLTEHRREFPDHRRCGCGCCIDCGCCECETKKQKEEEDAFFAVIDRINEE